jgi:crotonobetainyl-CoA:carnitine CoA-transferase CaiB-like acyl-CoA transferase
LALVRPLDGVTVVAVEQAVAAPLATRHLADLGARVIKLERVASGDFARQYDAAVFGNGAHFVWLNRSKESVAIDLAAPDGREIVRGLLDRADVFLQNLAPGAAQRLGLAGVELRAKRPRLITVDMSGYGPGGPLSAKKAYDMLVQAETGLIAMTGSEAEPAKTGIPAADIAAGMYAFSGVLAALLRRATTGLGGHLEVNMFDAVVEWMGYPLNTVLATGIAPSRAGLGHQAIVPYDAYPTADGVQLLIGVQNDRGWATLASQVLKRPELAHDPRYATNAARTARRAEVDTLVAELTSTLTADDLLRRLDAAGIPAAALNGVAAVADHPQLRARDRWRPVDVPGGTIRAPLPPITLDGEEPRMDPVPALGEHTDRVLAELGYSAEQIGALRAAGAVG